MWRDVNSLSELEFLSETTLIEIIPSFRKDELHLLCGKYGPFKPLKPVKVPLWLAVQFKKSKKCKIVPPTWMNDEFLLEKVGQEKENIFLQELPYYFYEISQILFHMYILI
jgi:GINS complex subunit 2